MPLSLCGEDARGPRRGRCGGAWWDPPWTPPPLGQGQRPRATNPRELVRAEQVRARDGQQVGVAGDEAWPAAVESFSRTLLYVISDYPYKI
jgi:hypothetical protein